MKSATDPSVASAICPDPKPCRSIGPARAEDVPALVELLRALFALEADFDFDAAKQERGLVLLLASDAGCVLVAREAGSVIGMASVQLVISTAEGAPSAWIEDVCVTPTARGNGTGRALLNAALAWARSRGATRAQLLADLQNLPALAFYERLGWQATQLTARRILLLQHQG